VNLIRGLSPAPAAYTFLGAQALKIFTAEAKKDNVEDAPGAIHTDTAGGLRVAAANGYVFLKEVQLAGKKRMTVRDFLRGYRLDPKTILG
jgi:methionyl-tRNA formyltransferase